MYRRVWKNSIKEWTPPAYTALEIADVNRLSNFWSLSPQLWNLIIHSLRKQLMQKKYAQAYAGVGLVILIIRFVNKCRKLVGSVENAVKRLN